MQIQYYSCRLLNRRKGKIKIDYWQLLMSGSIAGFTIFLGLPVARLQNLKS